MRRGTVLALGCGGAVGAVSRFAVSLAMPTVPGAFPWGTFVINVVGSALLGAFLVTMTERYPHRGLVRSVTGTGVIGAFTTFSTMSVEAVLLARSHDDAVASIYVASTVGCGLVAVWLGMVAARSMVRIQLRLEEGDR